MADFKPTSDVQAISHLNVVVDDIEVATEFYRTVLGFEPAVNDDGPMNYPAVDLASFARDAGFADGRVDVDIRFLKHPTLGLHLELFVYRHPQGDESLHSARGRPRVANCTGARCPSTRLPGLEISIGDFLIADIPDCPEKTHDRL